MSDDVHIGQEGWLFLKGGSNNAQEYYTNRDAFPKQKLMAWTSLLDARNEWCSTHGIRYVHFLAPDKTSVYREYYRDPLPYFDLHPIRVFDAALSDRAYWLNILPNLMAAKQDHPQFFKTDSHWNFHGCLSAYRGICAKLGVIPNPEIVDRPKASAEIAMDLGQKQSPPVREIAEFAHMLKDSKRTYANRVVLFNESPESKILGESHYNTIVKFTNDSGAAAQLNVVLFGDSFCEYRPHMLTGMLAETFREVTFVWNHAVDFDFLKTCSPDILLTENVERFVNMVPVDGINVSIEAERRMTEIESRMRASNATAHES